MSNFRFFLTFCFFTAAAGMVRAQINAALGKPVTTQYSTSSSAATYPGDYGAAKLTDGDPATFSHPGTMAVTAGFKYDINLGRTYALDRLRLYNRNNCCPERLSNYRVSILADNGSGVPVTPALWTAVIRGNGTNSGAGGVDEILPSAHPAGTFTGQWVRIENISGAAYTTQVAEVQALTFDCGDAANLALCRPAGFYDSNHTPAATWAGYPAANLTDGSLATFSHPGTLATPAGHYYEIDLLSDTELDRVLVYGRSDGCCPERLSNYRLALFADQQGVPGPKPGRRICIPVAPPLRPAGRMWCGPGWARVNSTGAFSGSSTSAAPPTARKSGKLKPIAPRCRSFRISPPARGISRLGARPVFRPVPCSPGALRGPAPWSSIRGWGRCRLRREVPP